MKEDFLTQRCALVGFPDGLAHQDKERKDFWYLSEIVNRYRKGRKGKRSFFANLDWISIIG
jgi:hypothetical protein